MDEYIHRGQRYIEEYNFNIRQFVTECKTPLLICICISLFVHYILQKIKNNYNLPPGPWGLPFVGRLPWMERGAQHTYMVRLAQDYGDLCSVRLGSKLAVCVSCPVLLKQMFGGPDFLARPDTPLNGILEGYGIVLSEGPLWRSQKMFIAEKLRILLGTRHKESRAEQLILMEVGELLDTLDRRQGEPVDPLLLFGLYVHNVICQITMSYRFKENDPLYIKFNNRVTEGMRLYGEVHLAEYLPVLMWLPSKRAVVEAMRSNLQEVSKFHQCHVDARVAQRGGRPSSQPPADLLDCYLDKIYALDIPHNEERDIFHNVDRVRQLVQVMNDLFSAGMETVRSTLGWLLVTMLHWPHVGRRVRRELAEVTGGPGALVTLDHKDRLPYTEATILETLRRITVVPLGTIHSNSKEATAKEYKIPPHSLVIPLLSKIHMNPASFPEPEQFRPERFLKNGRVNVPEHFMPFGVGRRMCIGDSLAKKELFLFFANIMNNYEFMLAPGVPMPGLEGPCGATHVPDPYKVCFVKRHNI